MDESTRAKTLYLVDGTSQLFRAFFAIRGLTNDEGVPTSAVYGFVTMLRKLLQDEKPEYIAVAFDLTGPTFRQDRYAAYKAHRPPVPQDLSIQTPYAKEACRALRIPTLELEGYEADDLIATYARNARDTGFDVVVVASDKDLLQLVDDRVTVLNPSKNVRLDATGVTESFGVPPERVRDVLGLMGDSVDNIPGVPGVGEKTALAMIAAYGDLESVIERARLFVGAFEARDALLLALDAASSEDSLREETLGRVLAGGAALSNSLAALRAKENDPEWRRRLDRATEAVGGGILDPLSGHVGRSGRAAVRELRPLVRELRDLEKGSARRAWQAVHENREQALLSRELATLDRTVPVEFEAEPLRLGPPDRARLAALYRSLAFRSLLTALEEEDGESAVGAREAEPLPVIYERVVTREALGEVVAASRAAGRFAIDTETTGGDPMLANLLGISIAHTERHAAHIPFETGSRSSALPIETIRDVLGPLLADASVEKIGHSLKYDAHVLRRHRLSAVGWRLDTMVAAFLLDSERRTFDLPYLAQHYLGHTMSKSEDVSIRRSKQMALDEVEADSGATQAAEKADLKLRLARRLEERLAQEGILELYRTIDGPLLPVLAKMEERGIRVDTSILHGMSREMESALEEARQRVCALAGIEFNVDSPKQLREVLFERLGLTARRRTAKNKELSTDATTLEELAEKNEIARQVLEYRELAKLKGTYVDTLPQLVHPETGRVHTSFHPTGAATGRLSSSDPNLQNIPARTAAGRKIRSAFVPDPGYVYLASDYSQVELRVLAHLCGDPELVAAFSSGEDIHRRTASRVFGVAQELVTDEMRRRAKAVNFGILYGMSESRLARDQGLSRIEARQFIRAYFERFRGVKEYIERVREQATRDAKVTTLFGRVRRFPELRGNPGRALVEQALRAAVNTTIQGTAADLMKLAMLRVEAALGAASLGARMLLQVHDELLFEVPEAEIDRTRDVVREAMEGVHALEVPLVVDQKIGRSWLEVT